MKLPKEIKRYCPKCRCHTTHKTKEVKGRGRNAAHPLSKFSMTRLAFRNIGSDFGTGNKGRYSRGAMNSWKRYNKKMTKKVDLRYVCNECNKQNVPGKKANRTKKLIIE